MKIENNILKHILIMIKFLFSLIIILITLSCSNQMINENKNKIVSDSTLAMNYDKTAMNFFNISSIDSAMKYYLLALKHYELSNNLKGIWGVTKDIGKIYYQKENYKEALKYFNKSLSTVEKLNYKRGILILKVNISAVYNEFGMSDSALSLQRSGFNSLIAQKIKTKNDSNLLVQYLNEMGNSFLNKKEYDSAFVYWNQAEKLTISLFKKHQNLIAIYYNYADLNRIRGKINQIDMYYLKGVEIAKEFNKKSQLRNGYFHLYDYYKSINNIRDALYYFEMYEKIKNEIVDEESNKKQAELVIQYQTEKKERVITSQNLEIVKSNSQKQNLVLILLIISIFSISVMIFVFIQISKKRKLALMNIEINNQKNIVIRQKEQLEEIHYELTDSIQYAKRIQTAVLPSVEYISVSLNIKTLLDYFILFKPRNIVSGDFYFFERKNNLLFIAVADCTGHGVPGAFMSMLGISFLQEIIVKEEINTSAHILNELRDYIIKSLQQKGLTGEQKDGMDISFLTYNLDTNIIQFAGANNPLYLIPNRTKEFIEIRPDKMPVAIYEKMNPFTNNEIQLQKGDIFYLTSDGFEDQFGGPKGKKFLSKNLKRLIIEHCNQSMVIQNEVFDKTIEDWKNNYGLTYEQTDDITIMGIKII